MRGVCPVTQPDEAGQWHGWANGNAALFISPTPDGDYIGLYLQQDRSTELAAIFTDPAMAQMVMDWQDAALAETAKANTDLLHRLHSEQPLVFQQPRPQVDPEFVEDDDDVEGP